MPKHNPPHKPMGHQQSTDKSSPPVWRAHGGPQGADDTLLDFSVNTNPYGPHPRMVAAIRKAVTPQVLGVYPDPAGSKARQALAQAHGGSPDQVVVANGSAELIWGVVRLAAARMGQTRQWQPQAGPSGGGKTLAMTRLRQGRVVVVEPAFSEFRAASQAHGLEVVPFWLKLPQPGEEWPPIPWHSLSALVAGTKAGAVYLCAPGNPTGQYVSLAQISRFARAHPEVLMVADEAYLTLSGHSVEAGFSGKTPKPDGPPMLHTPPNLVRLRSLTKDHTLPGLRVGYLLADPLTAQKLEQGRPAWGASAPALAAAEAACLLEEFVAQSRTRLQADKLALTAGLKGLGLEPLASDTPYFLLPVPPLKPETIQNDDRAAGPGNQWALALSRFSIRVRDGASFGLPGYLRLAARPAEDRLRLLEAMGRVLETTAPGVL